MDPDVVIVTSGERRTFQRKLQGIEITNQIDAERIFQIYQDKGVIKPAVPAERGDASWQMAFALGYHACPSRKNTWMQLIGCNKFKIKGRDWPEWRMPGWQPDSIWELEEQEEFMLYFNTYGPHIFISRLLRHGLVYGGMEAVVPSAPLKDCFLIFLQGAMEEPELKRCNPLALTSDSTLTLRRDTASPAVRLYNPAFEHLRTPAEREKAKKMRMAAAGLVEEEEKEREKTLFPQQPSSTTSALDDSAQAGEEEGLEEGELAEVEDEEETVEIVEEEAAEEAAEEEEPLQICAEEDDLLLDGNNNEPDSASEPRRERKDTRRPKKGTRGTSTRSDNNNNNRSSRSDADIRDALRQLAGQEAAAPPQEQVLREVKVLAETIRVPQHAGRLPLAQRLGPIPAKEESAPVPSTSAQAEEHPGYFTRQWEENHRKAAEAQDAALRALGPADEEEAALQQGQQPDMGGGPDRRGHLRPRFAPFDHRSRTNEGAAAADLYREEAKFFPPAQVAVIAPDRNMVLAARTARGPKPQQPRSSRKGDRRQHRKLSKRLLDHPVLSLEQVVTNAYVAAPIFDKRCTFCASWHCSRYLKGTRTLNCATYKEQLELAPTRRICDYRRCGTAAVDHHTAVCPILHARCGVCHCRGHTAAHGCNLGDERIMERLRYDFEEYADIGVYTKKRFANLAWGFYPYPSSAPRHVVVVSYRRLSDMPVLAAIGLLETVLQLPENRALPQGGVLESGHRLTAHTARGQLSAEGADSDWGEEEDEESDDHH